MQEYVWSVALQTGQPVGTWVYLAHAAVLCFSIVLFSLSLYAWSRRKHVGLILVTSAFLLFCLKEVLWLVSQMYGFSSLADLIRTFLDFVVLGLFFVAITLRPRKKLE